MDPGFRSESTKPLRMHSENLKGSESSEQSTSALDREIIGRIGGGENRPKNNDRSGSSSSNQPTGNLEASSPEHDLSVLSKSKSGSVTFVSSSSSSASLDGLFQVEAGELIKPKNNGIAPSLGHDEHCPLKLRKGQDAAKVSSKPEHDSETSSGAASTSPMSDITQESLLRSTSPTQSPPIQMMDRSGGYSPYRIPSSVFERSKPSTPVEWSIASNESLFSIHIGNNSFSRDHVITPVNCLKSDELSRSNKFITISPPPLHEVASLDQIVDMEKTPAANAKSTEFTKGVQKKNGNSGSEEKTNSPVVGWSSSRLSNESRMSAPSFSFPVPIKKKSSCPKPRWMRKMCVCQRKKCVWPLCYCSKCSQTSCYRKWTCCFIKWPSCFCKWPTCHCCKWPTCSCKWPSCCHCKCSSCYCPKCSCAFCYHWNCSRKWFCCSSTILMDVEKSNHARLDAQGLYQLPSATETTPRSTASECACWSCHSCRPCHSCCPCFSCNCCDCCCHLGHCC